LTAAVFPRENGGGFLFFSKRATAGDFEAVLLGKNSFRQAT